MFYTTDDNGNNVELYEDNIFTYCPDCGRKVYVDEELFADIILETDLAGTTVFCDECDKKRIKERTKKRNINRKPQNNGPKLIKR